MKSLSTLFFLLLLSVSSSVFAAKVNINMADAKTIASTMKGIGQSRAQAIVDYRKINGKYHSIDDLAKVKGVGIKTLKKNQANFTF